MDWDAVIHALNERVKTLGSLADEIKDPTALHAAILISAALSDSLSEGLNAYRRPLTEREKVDAGIRGYSDAHPKKTKAEVADWFNLSVDRVSEVLANG